MTSIDALNEQVLTRLSRLLCEQPRAVTSAEMAEMCALGLPPEEAWALLVCSLCGVDPVGDDEDKRLYHEWFRPACHVLRPEDYACDPYLQRVRFPAQTLGRWEMHMERYAPYEAFVCGDMRRDAAGRVVPQLGCFPAAFPYPAVMENGREWMTVTPNEIETIRPVAQEVAGDVVTLGLGLGYFAFLALERPEVTRLTVVEHSEGVLALFRRALLPQFPHPEKLRLLHGDAFDWMARELPRQRPDWLFADLWHDVSDGLPLWKRLRTLEALSPGTRYRYWIEPTLRIYA